MALQYNYLLYRRFKFEILAAIAAERKRIRVETFLFQIHFASNQFLLVRHGQQQQYYHSITKFGQSGLTSFSRLGRLNQCSCLPQSLFVALSSLLLIIK